MISYSGSIEIIVGPTRSGKSDELNRRLTRVRYARQDYVLFLKVAKDSAMVVHGDRSICISSMDDIFKHLNDQHVVAFDDAHLFDDRLVSIAEDIAYSGGRVIVAGLDVNHLGVPFEHMANLLCVAEQPLKLDAVCVFCFDSATKSITNPDEMASNKYVPCCRSCFKLRVDSSH